MKKVNGWWCPDYDTNLEHCITSAPRFAGRPTYQLYAYRLAIPHIMDFRCALDIGGHIGLWSAMMSPCFDHVMAFEPMPSHVECFRANHLDGRNVFLWPVALGDKDQKIAMATKGPVSLKARVHTKEPAANMVEVQMRPLDYFKISRPIDFIKIDCEGYELFAIKGGEETIRRNRPAMVVEQKIGALRYGLEQYSAVKLLESWGAKVRQEKADDFFMSWDD